MTIDHFPLPPISPLLPDQDPNATAEVIEGFFLTRKAGWCFGDGPPSWRQGWNKRANQTSRDAKMQRDRLVDRLQKYGERKIAVRHLARKIGRCRPSNPCLSGACPICVRALQRWFVNAADKLTGWMKLPFSVASIVPVEGRFTPGEARADILRDVRASIDDKLSRAGIAVAFGGFDPGINEYPGTDISPHGQVQAWIMTPTARINERKRPLRRLLTTSPTNLRPLYVRQFDGRLAGYAYAFKSEYVRRISLPLEENADGSTLARQNTKLRHLRRSQECELAINLDRAGLAERLFLLGAKVASGRHGPSIRVIERSL